MPNLLPTWLPRSWPRSLPRSWRRWAWKRLGLGRSTRDHRHDDLLGHLLRRCCRGCGPAADYCRRRAVHGPVRALRGARRMGQPATAQDSLSSELLILRPGSRCWRDGHRLKTPHAGRSEVKELFRMFRWKRVIRYAPVALFYCWRSRPPCPRPPRRRLTSSSTIAPRLGSHRSRSPRSCALRSCPDCQGLTQSACEFALVGRGLRLGSVPGPGGSAAVRRLTRRIAEPGGWRAGPARLECEYYAAAVWAARSHLTIFRSRRPQAGFSSVLRGRRFVSSLAAPHWRCLHRRGSLSASPTL